MIDYIIYGEFDINLGGSNKFKFDDKFSSMEPTKFIKDVLVGKLCAKMIMF